MKFLLKITLITTAILLCTASLDAKIKRSRSSASKTPSIEAIYNACVHKYNPKSCGLKHINSDNGKYGGTGFYDRDVYAINVKAIKKGTNLTYKATGPHAFYFQKEYNETPTGLSLTFYYFGFSNKADCEKFCSLLRRDGIDVSAPGLTNGWYELEVNKNAFFDL